jgi:hypothetical protein
MLQQKWSVYIFFTLRRNESVQIHLDSTLFMFHIFVCSKLLITMKLSLWWKTQNLPLLQQLRLSLLISSFCMLACQIFLYTKYKNRRKYTKLILNYLISIKYTKWQQYAPSVHRIYQHSPFQGPPIFTQIRIFGSKKTPLGFHQKNCFVILHIRFNIHYVNTYVCMYVYRCNEFHVRHSSQSPRVGIVE